MEAAYLFTEGPASLDATSQIQQNAVHLDTGQKYQHAGIEK